MRKEDLLVDYVAELYDKGGTCLCRVAYNDRGELSLTGEITWFQIEHLNDDLEYLGAKIMKVYGRAANIHNWKLSTEGRTLLWERETRKEVELIRGWHFGNRSEYNWINDKKLDIKKGDTVIVETKNGNQFVEVVAIQNTKKTEEQIKKYKSVVRNVTNLL